ncbi:MAG: hypothetical protein H6647_22030 [Anaerolineales bacterium]|nr:hypothetical protein [Anaerolineales bacterium]
MVKTTTAENHNFICPACGDELGRDLSGKGYVRHRSNPTCQFEKGQKDSFPGMTMNRPAVLVSKPIALPDSVTVCGYSERGAFNALLHEISYSDNANELLMRFLNLVRMPRGAIQHEVIDGVEVLLEPSLSDFGNPDAVALIHGANRRCVVFFEGKVKTSRSGSWTIEKEWTKFTAGVKVKVESSNLFTQLYHKVRFVSALRSVGVSGLQNGIEFPACSRKQLRKIGDNPVVLRTAAQISNYLDLVQFVAVVPDSPRRVEAFFRDVLPNQSPGNLQGWDVSRWGYLCWSDVEEFCRQNQLMNSLRMFEFNRGQIC